MKSAASPCGSPSQLRHTGRRFCRPSHPCCLDANYQRSRTAYPSVPPHPSNEAWQHGTINPFSISYAFRPRLRGRLTLGRLSLPRKPWAYGGQVSHLSYRYSCQHYRFRLVQQGLRTAFIPSRNAPLPITQSVIPRLRCHA